MSNVKPLSIGELETLQELHVASVQEFCPKEQKLIARIQSSTRERKTIGYIGARHHELVKGLLDEPDLSISATYSPQTATKVKGLRRDTLVDCELELTILGDLDHFDWVGEWLQYFDSYLQDPRECHLDVKYCNPHKLSFIDVQSSPMVSEIIRTDPGLIFETVSERQNLLDDISDSIELEEAPQPQAIESSLKRHVKPPPSPFLRLHSHQFFMTDNRGRHQKQALHFMICREQGWCKRYRIPDIWDQINTDRGTL
jgi:hypothetical protein